MALMHWATHVLQWQNQREAKRKSAQILNFCLQYGLKAATRFHEGGITSNRKSACYGEYVPELCTHRPSHAGCFSDWKVLFSFF